MNYLIVWSGGRGELPSIKATTDSGEAHDIYHEWYNLCEVGDSVVMILQDGMSLEVLDADIYGSEVLGYASRGKVSTTPRTDND